MKTVERTTRSARDSRRPRRDVPHRVAGRIELTRRPDADHAGCPQRSSDGFDLVSHSLERLDGGGLSIRLDQQTSQHGGRLAKRTQMMMGAEPDSLHRFRGRQAEIDLVQYDLQCRLILSVSTGDADGQHRFRFFEDQRWSQRDARPLTRRNAVGMAFPNVETLQSRAQPESQSLRPGRHSNRWV